MADLFFWRPNDTQADSSALGHLFLKAASHHHRSEVLITETVVQKLRWLCGEPLLKTRLKKLAIWDCKVVSAGRTLYLADPGDVVAS